MAPSQYRCKNAPNANVNQMALLQNLGASDKYSLLSPDLRPHKKLRPAYCAARLTPHVYCGRGIDRNWLSVWRYSTSTLSSRSLISWRLSIALARTLSPPVRLFGGVFRYHPTTLER
ncbi:hypothetical protein SSYM_1221, partial [Serratia symbiotica str. Tucson]